MKKIAEKNQLDTLRKGNWSSQANKRELIPKQASKASTALFDQLFLVESKVGDTSSRYCTEEKLIEQLNDLNNHVTKLALALDHAHSKNTNSDALDAYSASSNAGNVNNSISIGSFHAYFEPLRMHLVSQHDDGSDTSGYAQIGRLQKRIESAEITISGWLAVGKAIADTSKCVNTSPSL